MTQRPKMTRQEANRWWLGLGVVVLDVCATGAACVAVMVDGIMRNGYPDPQKPVGNTFGDQLIIAVCWATGMFLIGVVALVRKWHGPLMAHILVVATVLAVLVPALRGGYRSGHPLPSRPTAIRLGQINQLPMSSYRML